MTWWQLAANSLAAEHPGTDVDQLAAQLGVEIQLRPLTRTLWGATVGIDHVFLNSGLNSARREFALAHELGHVLMRRRGSQLLGGDYEEAAADDFALLMVTNNGRQRIETWCTEWARLRGSAEEPRYKRVGAMTVCGVCGPRSRAWYCRCGSERNAATGRAPATTG